MGRRAMEDLVTTTNTGLQQFLKSHEKTMGGRAILTMEIENKDIHIGRLQTTSRKQNGQKGSEQRMQVLHVGRPRNRIPPDDDVPQIHVSKNTHVEITNKSQLIQLASRPAMELRENVMAPSRRKIART